MSTRPARSKRRKSPPPPLPEVLVPEARPPRLAIDFVAATIFVGVLAFGGRTQVNPDGVAYLELAEALVRGEPARLVQGYWSPGLAVLLAPLVALIHDRLTLAAAAHALQAGLGILALGLGYLMVRRMVAPALQRVAWWGTAWIVIRWLAPSLITPDLLLSVLVLGGILLLGHPSRAARIGLGTLAGAAFLVKASIWPWLAVAGALLLIRRLRSGTPLPWAAIAPAVGIVGCWLGLLSFREGRPTLGSVGRLSYQWYLGDLSRRTPDTDTGPHAARRTVVMPPGARVDLVDLGPGRETYLPWSDPERWARGVPPDAVPRFRLEQAVATWKDNATVGIRQLVPLLAGLLVLVGLAYRSAGRPVRWRVWLGERPLLIVGLAAVGVFLVIHLEPRLIAPGGLLCIAGALGGVPANPTPAVRRVSIVVCVAIALILGLYLRDELHNKALFETTQRKMREFLLIWPGRGRTGFVVFGEAVPFMGTLWVARLHVEAQFGDSGMAAIGRLPAETRDAWFRSTFPTARAAVVWQPTTSPRSFKLHAW